MIELHWGDEGMWGRRLDGMEDGCCALGGGMMFGKFQPCWWDVCELPVQCGGVCRALPVATKPAF